ncbi:hypothetical protein J3B02_002950 [Coemansia erecta]|uniref:gluconokinase n=1 Tax=Coemansia asiatica TaxID=1052880 RepID=A0A9W7XKV1_9FUNG|nr:hypothetical protein LPJ64_001730 [Coemansia asiatica]KAJ2853843.1 hypothetical protein J3B02_002950 [Coemansia erecta]KAJ2885038.1 hypothetical protein FB639_001854 [Coemansia asiatica]
MRVQESYSEFPVRAVVVMGVSGSGKTTIGTHLAHLLGNAPFIDADTLHPLQNIEMMKHGQPLTDSNRWPWLKRVREEIEKMSKQLLEGQGSLPSDTRQIISTNGGEDSRGQRLFVVCACSALKRSYREFLSRGDPDNANVGELTHDTVFVYVDVSKAELVQRLGMRRGHFFNVGLLDSQLETLEPPDVTREAAIAVYGDGSVEDVVQDACRRVCGYVTKNT